MSRRVLWIAFFTASFLLIFAPAAHAYLDPGSGSFIFQVLIGGLLAAGVTVKAYGARIRGFLSRRSRKGKAEEGVANKVG